ncbi:hypothetical protein FJY68_03630 [candidate division WOR-3 bacterium]|uniref:Uncharacterized protein n=1 Tax=candidate division WOR-3 bacterium TaxID=2052148 RepID=A0A938BP82_UNCW3|nr:hypothetical protein [candidate division WOR-3 bacterium]
MRTLTLVAIFVVLAGAFCAGNSDQRTSPMTSTKWPKEALSPLSEDELVQFVKALPALSGALKAGKWETKPQREGTSPLSTLTDLVEGMKVAGINESLKPFGGWARIRPTLYKVFAATAALVIDRASPEFVEGMKQDTTAGGRRSLQDFEFFKSACTQVPEANKQLVTRFQEQLQPLGSLGN